MLYLLYFLGLGQVIGCFMSIYSVFYMRQNRLKNEKYLSDMGARITELQIEIRRGEPREQYKKVAWVINRRDSAAGEVLAKLTPFVLEEGRTITASLDDAGLGRLDEKHVVMFLFDGYRDTYEQWFRAWYPGVQLHFVEYDMIDSYLAKLREDRKEKAPI